MKTLASHAEINFPTRIYGQKDMHYMQNQSIKTPTWEELEHDQHLELQEHMWHPIVFHAEMMGGIMMCIRLSVSQTSR